MLTNYIIDTDLKKYYPKLASYLWTNQADYSTQIAEAFEIVLDELRARDIEPRRLHLPLDLNRAYDSSAVEDQLIQLTKTANGNGTSYAVGLTGFRRFVVNVIAKSGTSPTLILTLKGSNDVLIEAEMPVNWNTVTTLSFTDIEQKTIVFTNEYKHYRVAWTIGGTTPSFTFNAGLVETYVDRWIIWKALQIIFEDFSKEQNDIWIIRSQEAQRRFESALQSSKFTIDNNDDNIPVIDESGEGSEIRFGR